MSVQDIFDPLKPVSSPAEWKAYQTMGATSDAVEVASMFVKTTTRKTNPAQFLNLPGFCVAREILVTVCHPFCNSTARSDPKPLTSSL
jgi:hypothetical protein